MTKLGKDLNYGMAKSIAAGVEYAAAGTELKPGDRWVVLAEFLKLRQQQRLLKKVVEDNASGENLKWHMDINEVWA